MTRLHEVKQVEFRVDMERIMDQLTVDEMVSMSELFNIFYKVQQKSQQDALPMLATLSEHLKTTRSFLCKLVWNGDGYMVPEQAAPVVGKLTLRQLVETLTGIMDKANENAGSDAEAGGEPVE